MDVYDVRATKLGTASEQVDVLMERDRATSRTALWHTLDYLVYDLASGLNVHDYRKVDLIL